MSPGPSAADPQLQALNRLFMRSLLALGAAGSDECHQACRLAAAAWSQLRDTHPREAERLNGVLHALTRSSHPSPSTTEVKHGNGT